MKNHRLHLSLGIIVLLIATLSVYASNYGQGSYSAGDFSIGESTGSAGDGGSPGGSSGGGGGSGGSSGGIKTLANKTTAIDNTAPQCSQNIDCTKNQYCFENKCYNAQCFDDSVCNVEIGETCWDYRCVKLFDIKILDFESPVKLGDFFEFTYLLKGLAEVNGDVIINFLVEKEGIMMASGSDTIYIGSFEEKIETAKIFLPTNMESGIYFFKIKLTLDNYSAEAHRSIEIGVNGDVATIISATTKIYIISTLISLAIVVLAFIFYLERKKIKSAIAKEKMFILEHKFSLLALLLFLVIGFLIYYFRWYLTIASLVNVLLEWIKIIALPYFLLYRYFILGGIVLLSLFISFLILAKRSRWVYRLRQWSEKKKKLKESNRRNKPSEFKKRNSLFHPIKGHKILLSVIAIVIFISAIIVYLFYINILPFEKFKGLLILLKDFLISVGYSIKDWFLNIGK